MGGTRLRSRLHSYLAVVLYLQVALGFSTFVLAAINIRKMLAWYGSYNPVDPAAITVGILSMCWFLCTLVIGMKAAGGFRPAMNLLMATFHLVFFLAVAIAYTATAFSGRRFCSAEPATLRAESGCEGLLKSLIAISWIDFVLCFFNAMFIFLLATKHAKQPWTGGRSGWDVATGRLCPTQAFAEAEANKGIM